MNDGVFSSAALSAPPPPGRSAGRAASGSSRSVAHASAFETTALAGRT